MWRVDGALVRSAVRAALADSCLNDKPGAIRWLWIAVCLLRADRVSRGSACREAAVSQPAAADGGHASHAAHRRVPLP